MLTIGNISIKHCARCNQDHDNLLYHKFAQPIQDDDSVLMWEYWATCPITGDPILIRTLNYKTHEATVVKEAITH